MVVGPAHFVFVVVFENHPEYGAEYWHDPAENVKGFDVFSAVEKTFDDESVEVESLDENPA